MMYKLGMSRSIGLLLILFIMILISLFFFAIWTVLIFGLGLAFFYFGLTRGFHEYMLIASATCIIIGVITIFVDFSFLLN